MITFSIGYNVSGNVIIKELSCLQNLFVSYMKTQQVKQLYEQIINTSFEQIDCGLLICKDINRIDTQKYYKIETYIYDNPLSGTIQKKNKIFNKIFKEFIKLKTQPQQNKVKLIVIDDIWELIPKLNKQNISELKQLLAEGAGYAIHFIIGSSMPFRNLLLQLMSSSETIATSSRSPLNQLGAEIIFNPDEMIFFREKNQLQFNLVYQNGLELQQLEQCNIK